MQKDLDGEHSNALLSLCCAQSTGRQISQQQLSKSVFTNMPIMIFSCNCLATHRSSIALACVSEAAESIPAEIHTWIISIQLRSITPEA